MRTAASLFAGIAYTASLVILLAMAAPSDARHTVVEIGPVTVIAVEAPDMALQAEDDPASEMEAS